MLSKFRQRSSETERLDRGEFTPEEYSKWHDEMWYLHRMFGEYRALRRSLGKDIDRNSRDSISVLDVGAGSGDLLLSVISWQNDRDIFAVAAEGSPLAASKLLSSGLKTVICNGLILPFADRSFDYVTCSLTLHHLPDAEAIKFLAEMRRVASKSIYVVDLHRSLVAYYFYRAVGRIFLQKFTRDDGALSILRSFKPDELLDLAKRAGIDNPKVFRSAAYRLVLTG
jgi:ubiquinone/menaquinone biosynthesis C-methylase UbiE